MGKNINLSIVLFNSEFTQITNLVKKLQTNKSVNQIYLVDNSPLKNAAYENCGANYKFIGNNLGYGAGHNIAIKNSINDGIKYHLVLNSDIYVEKNTLDKLLEYLEANDDVGLIMPKIKNEDGTTQLLPKLLPSPFDLLIRIFSPLKILARKRSHLYVLADFMDKEINIPIISGCFSLFRVEALKKVGLYDVNFFMYFEDFDLSRRIHSKYKTIYYPKVTIIHSHERGAVKSFRLFKIFIASSIVYFNKYGWFFDSERNRINKKVFDQFK